MSSIKNKTHHFFVGGEQFKKEYISQLKFLIIVTLGFTVAFTWRQTIFDTTESLVQLITHVESSAALSILTSLAITLISLLIIFTTSRFLNPKNY